MGGSVNLRGLISTPSTFNSIATVLTRLCVAAAESGDWPAMQNIYINPWYRK
jgi:hypothetical protein